MPKRVNKEKAEAYIKEYVNNGFNKTKAYQKIAKTNYPNANYHATRNHNKVVKGYKFNLEAIDTEYIIDKLNKLANTAKNESVKCRALELLGKFRSLFVERIEHKDTSITPQLEDSIRNYITGNKLSENL